MRLVVVLCLGALVGCHSAQLRGPGPGRVSAVGHPGNRETAMPPPRNHPTNYGYGAAYDPHGTGGRAQAAHPAETGAVPWWPYGRPWPYWPPLTPGRPIGVPPPVVIDE